MPLVPPCTRKRSPALSQGRANRLAQTVKTASGNAAASVTETVLGTGRQHPALATQYSAYPPPGINAQTASPIFQRASTPVPTSAIWPETSIPSSGDAPGGGG